MLDITNPTSELNVDLGFIKEIPKNPVFEKQLEKEITNMKSFLAAIKSE